MPNLLYLFHRLQALWRPDRVHDEIAEEMHIPLKSWH
jgi:hypothetical protein